MSKFLTYEDRLMIARLLQKNASFGMIGRELGKDRTTIAKEIKKYSNEKKSGRPRYPYNPCRFRSTCKAKSYVEQAVHINQHINVVYVPTARCTVLISRTVTSSDLCGSC